MQAYLGLRINPFRCRIWPQMTCSWSDYQQT